ncbi:MAG: DUF885 domain-containing protein [Candidatus Eremiobacteraeota bacterium]|nr:DUF885 domain-containing protein [Candidatus Eremiobacteraeota bacterium]
MHKIPRRFHWTTLLFVTLLAAATPVPPAANGASALDALADRYWQRQLANNYFLRAQLGEPIETIRTLSYANADDDAVFGQAILDGLKAIDAAALDHDRWLTYRTLTYLATNDVAGRTYYWLRQEATPYAGGSQITYITSILTDFQFTGSADARRYQSLLHQYAAFIRSMRELLEGQHQRGIILPNVETDASQAVFEAYAQPGQSGALIPNEARLTALAPADRAALRSAAEAIVTSEIVPAFQSVAQCLKGPYRAGAPAGVGLSEYPGGAEYYRYLVVANTTLTIEPEKLHAMGLEEVEKLNRELDGIRKEVGFHGDLRAFKTFLQHDPQFYVKTTEQFGERLEVYVRRAAAVVPQYFLRVPKAPYGVAPLPKELAGSQTFGYYDQPTAAKPKGVYLYNAWHPERTSALSAGALICHELIPGHHFQIALQQENTSLPEVRHYDFSETGFLEGWGEYASQLCWNMGVYQTPYDKAGRIMQDLMISTRLVVDTGMNALGWSRERAMRFMRENLTLSEAQIESESLRYSTDIPGQALAYKTGELTMLALRKHARDRLGAKFDIRQFHSWVIDSGSMTLDTLQAHVDYEIALRLRSR